MHEQRLEELLPGGKGLWIPVDHGVSGWPERGLEDMEGLLPSLAAAGADAIIAHKGVVSRFSDQVNMLMHISASTIHGGEHASDKVLVGSAEEALARGALGVSVQVNLGDVHEHMMLQRLGTVSEDCHRLGLPLLGMIYPRGPGLQTTPEHALPHCVRLAWELGCDVIKTSWPEDPDVFKSMVWAAPIPILIAGGPAEGNPRAVVEMVHAALQAGGAGVCMGRQIFAGGDPIAMVRALKMIIHEGAGLAAACEVL